jgi:signal transduction histidine kinase/ligand-binding sensor domain-containing protein
MRASVARSRRVKRLRRLAPLPLLVFTLCLYTATAWPQDLPAITYTTADGLAHDIVIRLLLDPRGFLWLGGVSGLARFDGERFTTYGRADGLDVGTSVNDLALGADGNLWIGTNGAGIFHFDLTSADPAMRFTQIRVGESRPSNRVNTILVGPGDQLWAGTDAGLFNGSVGRGMQRLALPLPSKYAADAIQIRSLIAKGSWVWVGSSAGVYRCGLDGTECHAASAGAVRSLVLGRDGRLRLVRADGIELWQLDAAGELVGAPETIRRDWTPRRIADASNGTLILSDDRRLIWTDTRTERVLFTSEVSRLNDIVEDSSGNLWMATYGGLVAIRRQGVTLFSAHRNLRQPYLRRLVRTGSGRPYVVSQEDWVHRIDGQLVTSARAVLPAGVARSLWPDGSIRMDSGGDIWFGTAGGLYRFSNVKFSADRPPEVMPTARYTVDDGLAGNHISEIFEDSQGDVWVANVPTGAETLTIWRRRASRFEKMGAAQGLPASNQLGGFVEDTVGTVWARLREGGLVRIRENRATHFGIEHGLPALVSALLIDRSGDLWIGGGDAVLRVRDASGDVIHPMPALTRLGETVVSLEQDKSGMIFVGTLGGLVVLDPTTGKVRRFSTFEGLPRGSVEAIVRAPDGALLLTAGGNLARLDPSARPFEPAPPRCLLSVVRVGGRPLPLPQVGVERIDGLDVQPMQNQVDIELVGLSPRLGEPLEYEYRLSGVTSEWTRAPERRVTYAGLAAGRYNFEARVSGAGGASISPPARVAFRVLPPWYRRWWFLSLVAAASLLVGYLAHHVRLAQAIRTERLRSRIATDLHDDIGSSLSQIAILAEVARRRAGVSEPRVAEPLASIATTSRDLVDAMSDIVWAVNPRTDALSDLTRRMHRFAEETLGGADIALTFSAPPPDVEIKIGTDLRREIYLIFKESVNNIARHSGASEAVVELTLGRHELRLAISDNGRGFDPGIRVDGNGITSMRKRAAAFGGVFTIDSEAGRGTRVSLTANLRRQPH